MEIKIYHADHQMTTEQKEFALSFFRQQTGFVLQTLTLPEELGTLPSALYGPSVGDAPVAESAVHYAVRGERESASRMVALPARNCRELSIIGNADEGVVYTMFGGPVAPREPSDPSLSPEELSESKAFWAVHALAASL